MGFNSGFNPFKRKVAVETAVAETGSEGEQNLRNLIQGLDREYGARETDQALESIFGEAKFQPSMSEVSNELFKRMEPLESKFGHDAVVETLVKIKEERARTES